MVDLLSLELVQDEADDDWFGLDRVRIRVNGIALRELAAAAGSDDDLCYPTAFLLGVGHLLPKTNSQRQAANNWFLGERTALMADGCGQPGCDSLLATITARDETIYWSDLSWYRKPAHVLSLGPYSFESRAYESELQHVRDLAGV